MKPLVYFVANESVSSGLLRAQLLQPLEGAGLSERVEVVNLMHPMARPAQGVRRLRTLRCGIPARLYQFKLGGLLDRLVAMYYAIVLAFVIPRGSVVVARSYFSALAVAMLKRIKPIDLVFDTRSQFVQENVSAGRLQAGSAAHKRWLQIELSLLNGSAKVLAVSEAQAKYYRGVAPQARVQVIPCFSQPDKRLLGRNMRDDGRRQMGFGDEDVVICYYGSLDQKWNNIDMYADFFAACLKAGYRVCIITPSADELRSDPRFKDSEAFIERVDDPARARQLIAACDYGVIIMKKADDWESRLGVKFVEYLGAGLQVMVGEWVGAAADTVRRHFPDAGTIVAGTTPRPSSNLQQTSDAQRLDIASRAESMFGYHKMRDVFDLDAA
ncbi:hypothetical protein LXT12_12970 [Pelomonas sp. P7]|uniref:Uncharacterized protein n=1 Tax=Pelomonas caseinilytica TaxID=2906763 RepID=A0ABS8XEH0_9BURK|nr:hypothetical protein [Pelomonas sp. P7]MCE4538163.1 hypothetical protein [Pelomonas sp. P7]